MRLYYRAGVCVCVCLGSRNDEREEKQRDPLLGALMHYQPPASQQASTSTYQGVELLYLVRAGLVSYKKNKRANLQVSLFHNTTANTPEMNTRTKRNKIKVFTI